MPIEGTLAKKLIGKKAQRQLIAYIRRHLAPMEQHPTAAAWQRAATRLRRQILQGFFKGHPPGLLEEKPRIRWGETLKTTGGYHIRKLRYEGYPGLWVPALLYQPDKLKGKVAAVLNPNGHHRGGKAMDYKQARCINLAKRGALALNTEFIGMGELADSGKHNRIGQLDLAGLAGIGVFYLLMKRGLDVLLAHPNADPDKVAMTGLSGGGWQTALLSALDPRVKVVVPVAGHSPIWQRAGCVADIGDLEQVPTDLGAIADFDTLSALFAPRPTLLIYNRDDNCCFQTKRTYKSIYRPLKPVFKLMGAADRLAFHDNTDPGTHNYEQDNRQQLYRFLKRHLDLEGPDSELPWRQELFTEAQLNVGLPADNASLLSLAQKQRQRLVTPPKRTPASARKKLAALIDLNTWKTVQVTPVGKAKKRKDHSARHHILHLDQTWEIPVTEFAPSGKSRGTKVLVGDSGRPGLGPWVQEGLAGGHRIWTADIFGSGEHHTTHQYHMLVSTAGRRSLGIQVGQILALAQWLGRRGTKVHLAAQGQVLPVAALIAAALVPKRFTQLKTHTLLDSLTRLIDLPLDYEEAAPLFCFGLLPYFDICDLVELSAPVGLEDENRGPLRG